MSGVERDRGMWVGVITGRIQGVIKRRLFLLTNRALVYESKCGGGGCGVSANEYRYSCVVSASRDTEHKKTLQIYLHSYPMVVSVIKVGKPYLKASSAEPKVDL